MVRATTYLRVLYIERDSFGFVEEEFPAAYVALREAAIWRRARRILLSAVHGHQLSMRERSARMSEREDEEECEMPNLLMVS